MDRALTVTIEQVTAVSDNDNNQLDLYVKQHANGSVYHLAAWRNAITSAYGHSQVVLIARNKANIVGYLPLCLVSNPLFGKKLVSLPFADFSGVLADTADIATKLLTAAQAAIVTFKAKKLEIRTRMGDEHTLLQLSDGDKNAQHSKVRMVVPLPEGAETLLASYKPKLRSQIKKAEKNGLSAELRSDLEALEHFYQIYARNMHRLGSPVHRFSWFKQLWQGLVTEQSIRIALVYFEKQPIAAGVVIICGKQAYIPWASTLNEFNHLAPNMLLYWHIQAYLANNAINQFDMGRSTEGEGTFRFKAQWGAEPELLCWLQYATPRSGAQLINTTSAGTVRLIAEKAWPQLPFKMATIVGAYLRKYITL